MDNIILQKTWVQGCPVIVDNLLGTAFTGEAQAHTFVVSGVDAAQEPVTITGTITGKFLAANNVTVPLTGSLVNGAASVTLTDECYDVPGRYILSIYATNGETTQCLYCAVGNVFRTDSQTIAYPSTDLPNITTLMAQLEAILDGWPADYSQLQSDVSNLKSAITTVQNDIDEGKRTLFFKVIENSYPNSSGFPNYNGWDRSDYIPVAGLGKVYIDNPTKSSNDNAFYAQDKSFISTFTVPIGTPAIINIPDNCAYIVISNKRTDFFTSVYVPSVIADIVDDIASEKAEIELITGDALDKRVSRQLYDRADVQSGYIMKNGNVYPDSNTYDYSPMIYVGDHVGDTVYFSANGQGYQARFVCAYDSNKSAIEASGAESVLTYTVPSGIAYIAVSFAKNADFQAEYDRITPKSDYFDTYAPDANTAVETVCFGGMLAKTSGDLSGGESFELTGVCSKKNNVFAFYGKVDTFTGIRIGQGLGYNRGYNLHVTSTGVSWQSGTTDGTPILHELTIKDYIGVVIDIDNDGVSHVTVSTNGGSYTRNVTPWPGSDSNIFATTDSGTVLTDCVFSFTAKDVKKPIWYFGDSYISNSDTRWPYYINQMGYYGNLYLDGFSGANSSQIYPDVVHLFELGMAPKYLIWAFGMNDGDSDAVNSSWFAYYTLLRDLCDKNDVDLILATIPNVPSVDNQYKNAVIRAAGLPYIDYAAAVNTAVDSSAWFEGMLSSDNVHPTAEGARALANRLVNDFPIIAE